MVRYDLDGNEITPLKICLISGGGFIGSHLCEKLMEETSHKVIIIDESTKKIKHLLKESCSWVDRIEFHKINIKNDSRFEALMKMSDLMINLAAIGTPDDYNTRPLDTTIYSNFIDAILVVKYCSEYRKRLIDFSTSEIYGKMIGSFRFLPKDRPLRQGPDFYHPKEDASPSVLGPIEKQRWSYEQLIEKLIFAEGAEKGLTFTIVRPFNWISPRMDFIPGVDGQSDGVPMVLACFSNNLLRGEPLKLVDGGQSRGTFLYIKDAIDAVLLMIENPAHANGQIFNVGNPDNEVSMKQLAEMMIEIYAEKSCVSASTLSTVEVSSKDFYGVGYDESDSERRLPDVTNVDRQLGWKPETSLRDLLEVTLKYQHRKYYKQIKKTLSQPAC